MASRPAPAEPSPSPTVAAKAPTGDAALFESRVRPLLVKHCVACHGAKTQQAGLRLDLPSAILKGGENGPVVVAGKPDASRLLEAVRYSNPQMRMPPAGRLSDAEIEGLTAWVRQGAPIPRANETAPGNGRHALTIEEGKRFWSIRPFSRTQPPAVKHGGWVSRRIDAYLLAKMEAAGLQPSPRADRRTLIRRVSFDLVGLPPSPEEVEAFVHDPAPDAYSRLVERLLASPHYGERWGRHWLDLARYCDIPESWAQTDAQAWFYRDWVVKALNDDLPYDRFVKLQLAADEIPATAPADRAALGFLGLSPSDWKELKLAPDVIKTVVAEEWEERITAVSGTLLGLTVGCARCHDHKFDPITQKDYYALAGVFASTRLIGEPLLPPDQAKSVLAAHQRVTELEAEWKRLSPPAGKATPPDPKLSALQTQIEQIRKNTSGFDAPLAYSVDTASLVVGPDGPARTRLEYRDGVGQDVPLQIRGNPAKPGPVVPRRFLQVLSPGDPVPFTQGSGRRELSEAIFRDSAPLVARVIVNRVWKHHFGRGIVETPSNFGTQGDRPTHPELLDDLAARFVEHGWSLKWLHREILLSSAYQQGEGQGPGAGSRRGSSGQWSVIGGQPKFSKAGNRLPDSQFATRSSQSSDPDNLLLARISPIRLEVEPWRDAILSAAGLLDLKMGGASRELSAADNVRRTFYGTVKRRELDDLLRLYDFPDPTAHSPARFATTTPLQQLYVLNSPFIAKAARALGDRLRKDAPGDPEAQVRRAYLLLYSRLPSPRELDAARAFLKAPPGTEPSSEAWGEYLEVLLARNELMFVE